MEIQECLQKIDELRNVLESVKFKLYFTPNEAVNVNGVGELDDKAVEIQLLLAAISNPPPPISS
jgi:hypothetical protein